jgi:hypothetical protein
MFEIIIGYLILLGALYLIKDSIEEYEAMNNE